jgi:hypothetical protein
MTIVKCSFASNQVVAGQGGGSAFGPDFFNRAGTILPTLSAASLGGGTALVEPASPPFLNNSLATVTAVPAQGWRFLYWLGDGIGTNTVLNPPVTRNKHLQAVFGTTLSGSALMTFSPDSDYYPYGTVVKLTALPPSGTYFASWGGDASGTSNPTSVAVTNPNMNVSYSLQTLGAGQSGLTIVETGAGHVTVSPNAPFYSSGQTVSLTAIPDLGQSFIGWSGVVAGSQNPLSLAVDSSTVITAAFTARPHLQVGTVLEGLVEGGFRLTVKGEFGSAYTIIGSSNLIDWDPVAALTNTYGTSQMTDPAGTNRPYRFYRATLP